jgi:translation initiation factor IF-2
MAAPWPRRGRSRAGGVERRARERAGGAGHAAPPWPATPRGGAGSAGRGPPRCGVGAAAPGNGGGRGEGGGEGREVGLTAGEGAGGRRFRASGRGGAGEERDLGLGERVTGGARGEEAAVGVTATPRVGDARGGALLGRLLGPKRRGRGGEGRWVAAPPARDARGGGRGGEADWAGRPDGPRAKGGRLGQKGEEREGREKKRFYFSNIYFLYECFHTFKQSKKCMVRHGAANQRK